jgi:hypothetical protein
MASIVIRASVLLPVCILVAVAPIASCSSKGASPRAVASAAPVGGETDEARRLTRFARLLAGVDDPLAAADDPLRASEAFRVHAREMGALWTEHNTTTAARIGAWVDQELRTGEPAQTLFYPFAGADFLFANAFFPRAHTYVLIGLERVGALKDLDALSARNVELEYGRVRKAVAPLLRTTFFRTLEMQSDVLEDGVLTVLATLIAGTHHRIVAIEEITLSQDGRVTERGSVDSKLTPGARIDFVDEGATDVKTLYYFRTDLSNQGLARQGGLLAFVDTLPSKATFTKAAAYRMHGRPFSVIRDYVLAHSQAVLEDDTGVPLRSFDRASWELRFFGSYLQPIPMFHNYRQPDLAEAFARSENVGPLPFHVGYGRDAASNLELAVRRNAPRPAR